MKLQFSKKLAIITGVTLVTLGLIGSIPTIYYQWLHKGSVSAHGLPHPEPVKTKPHKVISGHPVAISIPSFNINLPIIDGFYNANNGGWTLTLDKAQFATISPEPNNEAGNTFVYGHYRPEVFAYLHLIKPRATAVITTSNGYKFVYRFNQTYATSPDDTSVFKYKGVPMLTVQTCSGTWFQNRQMFLFDFVKYQKVKSA